MAIFLIRPKVVGYLQMFGDYFSEAGKMDTESWQKELISYFCALFWIDQNIEK